MLLRSLAVTLRILCFRSGPQDFPFGSEYLRGATIAALLALVVLFAQLLPLGIALAMAAAAVAGVAAFTRALLRARQLDARLQQTLAALLAVGAVQALLALPLAAELAPELLRVMRSPELLEKVRAGERLELKVAPIVPMMIDAICLWNILVSAHIYRHAANLRFGMGILVTLLGALMVMFLVMVGASLAGLLFGMPAR